MNNYALHLGDQNLTILSARASDPKGALREFEQDAQLKKKLEGNGACLSLKEEDGEAIDFFTMKETKNDPEDNWVQEISVFAIMPSGPPSHGT